MRRPASCAVCRPVSFSFREPTTATAVRFSSARFQLGTYRNDEFGLYTRYTYNGCDSALVITCGEKVLVLNAADEAATRALYEDLLARIG